MTKNNYEDIWYLIIPLIYFFTMIILWIMKHLKIGIFKM